MAETSVDVLIVGSGPIGATYARRIDAERPGTRLLMVDVGPRLTDVPGRHVRNIADERERLVAQVRSQGPDVTPEALELAAARAGAPPGGEFARPGTFYVDPERAAARVEGAMAAAAMSSNVGGMGAHWTCACPSPDVTELDPFVDAAAWAGDLATAQQLLSVTQSAFGRTIQGEAAVRALAAEFGDDLGEDRPLAPMPLACRVEADGRRYWTGPDVVLGPLATQPPTTFELRDQTLCQRLLIEDGRLTGALLRHVVTGELTRVSAKAVVVAGDGLRTPQLLWASGIRPTALGHYLNDHLQFGGPVLLDRGHVERAAEQLAADGHGDVPPARREADEPIVGVFWLPYSPTHPVHGQVMHFDMAPVRVPQSSALDPARVVMVGYFIPKQIRFQDCVSFSGTETDGYGMPRMSITYEVTEVDLQAIDVACTLHARAAGALGGLPPGQAARVLPPGTSLHYQGTVRMGAADDGASVCDSDCRVWGLENLFVGGNGVIAAATAGNPTLTSVAHAVRSARAVVAGL